MQVSLIITMEYEKKSKWTFGENKPNQSQFPPAQSWGLKVDGTAGTAEKRFFEGKFYCSLCLFC